MAVRIRREIGFEPGAVRGDVQLDGDVPHGRGLDRLAGLAARLGFAPIELGPIAAGGRLIQARDALVFQDLVRLEDA